MTPEEAAGKQCRQIPPSFDETLGTDVFRTCSGPACMMWRWVPLMADERYLDAVKKAKAIPTHAHITAAEAARYVIQNRAKFGLPEVAFDGYCGLAGKPEA